MQIKQRHVGAGLSPWFNSKHKSAQSVELSSFLDVHLSPEEHNLQSYHCQLYERGICSVQSALIIIVMVRIMIVALSVLPPTQKKWLQLAP